MNEFENCAFHGEQVLQLPANDRNNLYQRLQQLDISCYCDLQGYLHIETNNTREVILVRTVLMEFFASHDQLVTWLKQCWGN